jgi:hypothetical protein
MLGDLYASVPWHKSLRHVARVHPSTLCLSSVAFVLSRMMEPEEVGAILLLTTLRAETKKRKRRRLWVHPIIRDRQTGAFREMFSKLVNHPEKFYNYFRTSPSSYEEVHSLIEEKKPQRRTISGSIN